MAELQSRPPYVCLSLRPAKGKEKTSSNAKTYFFYINKSEQIFDILLKVKQLKLHERHKISPVKEVKKRKYCKYHNQPGHLTNSHVRFRGLIQ